MKTQAENDLATTLDAIRNRHWTAVLLEPGTKRLLSGRTWEECSTSDPRAVRNHLSRGGGVGLDVYTSGLVVLDFDVVGSLETLCSLLGPIPLTSTSPSGGTHAYFHRPEVSLSSRLALGDERVGDVIRGPRQQVLLPPSPYPGSEKRGVPAGGHYRWIGDPLLPAYVLPPAWLEHLTTEARPAWIPESTEGHPEEEPWGGPTPAEMHERARRQPGHRRRSKGAKFQCPRCHEEGHDRHRDNAFLGNDGRYGCAYAPGDRDHRRAIGRALGVGEINSEVLDTLVDDSIVDRLMRGVKW